MHISEIPYETQDGCETAIRAAIAQEQFAVAVGLLVQHYRHAMVSYCLCHLLDPELAREVAQEVFLAAFTGLPDFRGHSSVKTWLYGIAFKKCLEAGRNRTRREALVREHQAVIGAQVHCDPPRPPEDLVSQAHRRRLVWVALRRLRVYDRELLVLRYLEELTCDEIARILHVSRRTVERHLPRAEARFHHAYRRCQTHAVSTRQTTRDVTTYPGFAPLIRDASPS